MQGLCTEIIKHHEITERPDIADYPTYEVIASLSYPIEEGEHMHLELNDKLWLRDVQASQLHGDVYSLTFNLEQQDELRDHPAPTQDMLAAMMYAQHGYLTVETVVNAIRDGIRSVVPKDRNVAVTLQGTDIRITVADTSHRLSLRQAYTQHLLVGPMQFSWQEGREMALCIHYNMPPVEDMERWFEQHNQNLLDHIEDMPQVAACCLACTSQGPDLEYAYVVVLMNGSCTTTPMNTSQVLCMIASGKCPEVRVEYEDGAGLELNVFNDELLPQAFPHLEQLTDEQLALTVGL